MKDTPPTGAGNSVLSRWRHAIVDRFSRHPFSSAAPAATPPADPAELTWERLQEADERQLDQLMAGFFSAFGFRTEPRGADLQLFARDAAQPFGLIQRKWHALEVGERSVVELQSMLAGEGIAEGYIITTSSFTPAARAYDTGRKIMLIDGREFVVRFNRLPRPVRTSLLEALLSPEFAQPAA